ncbi:hypothetical protein D3C75_1371160 [compost metagenome]
MVVTINFPLKPMRIGFAIIPYLLTNRFAAVGTDMFIYRGKFKFIITNRVDVSCLIRYLGFNHNVTNPKNQ